ncbi:MAG: dienelactone hydrolase family protein [Magnetovibrio sp.]|nr:dienelactone hydrolase family protein [Magnetovibrio sp.]
MKKLFVICAFFLLQACTPAPPPEVSMDTRMEQLPQHFVIKKPTSAPPYKTVLVFHGARKGDAWDARYKAVTDEIVNNGYAAIFVDMFKSRGQTGHAVFKGKILPKETSGDVMLAIEWAKTQDWIDTKNIYAWGYSFGGATLMDALVYSKPGLKPLGLLDRPTKGAAGLNAIALISPWCKKDVYGFNIIASTHQNFGIKVPTLAVIPLKDTVSDQKLCQTIIARNIKEGFPAEVLKLDGAKHRFMFKTDAQGRSEPEYDAKLAQKMKNKIFSFMKEMQK